MRLAQIDYWDDRCGVQWWLYFLVFCVHVQKSEVPVFVRSHASCCVTILQCVPAYRLISVNGRVSDTWLEFYFAVFLPFVWIALPSGYTRALCYHWELLFLRTSDTYTLRHQDNSPQDTTTHATDLVVWQEDQALKMVQKLGLGLCTTQRSKGARPTKSHLSQTTLYPI